MSKKIVVLDEKIGKIDRRVGENKFSKELQRSITVTLACGDKVTFYDSDEAFHNVAQYLQPGDVISFNAEHQKSSSWNDDDGVARTTTKLSGLSDITVTMGSWSEGPIEGLAGRQKVADDAFKAFVPRDSAPPISGKAAFQQEAPVAGSGDVVQQAVGDVKEF